MNGWAGLLSDKCCFEVKTWFSALKKLWGYINISTEIATAVQITFAANYVFVTHVSTRGSVAPASAWQNSACMYFLFRQILLAICVSSPPAADSSSSSYSYLARVTDQ